MQLPRLQPIKRLLRFLGLGIGTTLLILVLSLIPIPSNAKLIPVERNSPDFAPPFGGSSGILTLSIPINLSAKVSQSSSSAFDIVQQGKINYQKGQLEEAVKLWQQAVEAFAAQGDNLHQAMTLSYLAQVYQQLGTWDQANSAITQSLELLNQPNQGTKGDKLSILAEALTIQGSLRFEQGKASDAFTSWQNAEKIFLQAGDSAGVIRSQINQSQALVTLGLYKRANNLLGSLYKKMPPEEPLQLAILLNYGETLRLVGQLTPLMKQSPETKSPKPQTLEPQPVNSQTVLEKGLDLAKKLNSPADITAAQLSLGNTYRALHQIYQRQQTNPCLDPTTSKDYQEAKKFYQQAEEQTNSPIIKVQALLNQQSLLFNNQSDNYAIDSPKVTPLITQKVQNIASRVQSQLDRLPINRTTLYARIQLAYNLLKIKNSPKDSRQASQILETAVKQAENLGDSAAQSYALGYLGQAYEQQQQGGDAQKLTTQALTLTTKALDLAKTLNAPEIAYRWFWQLGRLERVNNPKMSIKNYWSAYQMLEAFRKNLPVDNPDLQFSFQQRSIDPVYRGLADVLLRSSQTVDSAYQGLKENKTSSDHQPKNEQTEKEKEQDYLRYPLNVTRRVIEDLQNAELANFLQEPCASSNIEAIDNRVNEPGSSTAALYTILLKDRIEVIAKFPGQDLFHYSSFISSSEVRNKITQFQKDLQESYTFDAVKTEGQEFYKWLIKPIQEQLENNNIKTIVFALDGSLRNIPMAALHDGNGYLIEKYAISVTLDLEVKDPKPLTNNSLSVLTASLANPPKQLGQQFAKLDFVTKEVEAIEKTEGIKKVIPLKENDFTRELFNKKFSDFPFEIVHIATHGLFSSNPEETFILTAPSSLPNGKSSDGKVRLRDVDEMFRTRVLNRADAVELLILSACETASGDDRATLGIAGVAVRAGARSAIASLWSLDDESSQQLMKTFYEKITKPQTSRAEALRQAQLALLKTQDGTYAHPRYWSPFLLVGNWL